MSVVEKAMRKAQAAAEARQVSEDRSQPATDSLARVPDEAPVTARAIAAGVPVRIDRLAMTAEGLLPPVGEERQIAEQFRQIKRPLVTRALGADATPTQGAFGRLVAVTSALPGEGKTFTAFNLATSFALERDLNVVLIDGDVAKAHLSELMGLGREPGLVDVLEGADLDVETLVHPTDVPCLAVLGAGQRSDRSTELLASRRMSDIVTTLLSNDPSRVIVLDCPPLLLTNESRVVTGLAGQVLVVVRSAKTLQRDVVEALAHVPPGRAVGLVLNQSMAKNSSGYYGYHTDERAS